MVRLKVALREAASRALRANPVSLRADLIPVRKYDTALVFPSCRGQNGQKL